MPIFIQKKPYILPVPNTVQVTVFTHGPSGLEGAEQLSFHGNKGTVIKLVLTLYHVCLVFVKIYLNEKNIS